MIRAYKRVEETAESITYEYNPICGYWLYSSVVMLAIGYLLESSNLEILGAVVLVAYFVIVFFPALSDARTIRAAIKTSEARLSGSRWSLSNPLRITVPRPNAE